MSLARRQRIIELLRIAADDGMTVAQLHEALCRDAAYGEGCVRIRGKWFLSSLDYLVARLYNGGHIRRLGERLYSV